MIADAVTKTLGAGSTEVFANNYNGVVGSMEVMVKVAGAGVFLGNSAVTSTAGYELTPNVDYRFRMEPRNLVSAGSSDYSIGLKNNTGAGVVISYAVWPR